MNLDNARNAKLDFLHSGVAALQAETQDWMIQRGMGRGSGQGPLLPMVSVGIQLTGRPKSYCLAVRVDEEALLASRSLRQLRQKVRGEVDIRVVGHPYALRLPWTRKRMRPLQLGLSIGHPSIAAGTLGALVHARGTGEILILSNNHVLADVNRGRLGDSILSPGKHDGGVDPQDVVAHLKRSKRLIYSGPNYVDAAVAKVADVVQTIPGILRRAGKIHGMAPEERLLEEYLPVKKLGRTTGLRRGKVSAVELSGVRVSFREGKVAVFDNQIEIESSETKPFSRRGDSGSLIVTEDGWAVGLLFAGTDVGGRDSLGLTYANPLQAVLDALEIELISA